jgi:carnitine-CoA ligase
MKTVWQLIEWRAALQPDRPFLHFYTETITYGGLRRRVMSVATRLAAAGISPGDRVGLMMGNHPDHVVIYLALSWLGAVNVEFNTHFKPSGIQLQLEDADPTAIIMDPEFAADIRSALEALPHQAIRVFERGMGGANGIGTLSTHASDALGAAPHQATLDRLQAISYTSGTTGRPKGVMLTDRAFQIGAKNAGLLAGVRADDVLFLWEPFYHFAAWMTILMGLQHGVPIGLVECFSASRCWDQIRRYNATLLHYLGGAMNILLKQPPSPGDLDNPIRIAWGAAAPVRSWRQFERRFGVMIREGYGISEAQNFTHLNLDERVGSIGKPVEEFEAWIAGDDERPLQPGEIGEIVVRPKLPDIVMLGYFRDPARTADVLRHGCVYTGDLGYADEDGFFYYVGRKKDSLRRRGENISAWEVERVINSHPAVEESAVVGVASEMGEQDIRVFVKVASGEKLDPVDLIQWCERELTYYQIPRYVDFMEEFPRGPTQRIRKDDLPLDRLSAWDLESSGYKIDRKLQAREHVE